VLTLRELGAVTSLACGPLAFTCENPDVIAAVADALGPACPPLVCSEGWPSTACLRLCVRSARGAPEAIGTRGRLVREEQMVDVVLCDLSRARSASAMAG
jgi:hypothetical protein